MNSHWKHHVAQDLAVEMKRMDRLVQAARERERALAERRAWTVMSTGMRPSDDFEGCTE